MDGLTVGDEADDEESEDEDLKAMMGDASVPDLSKYVFTKHTGHLE